jgi:hypothetical protein
VVTKKDRPPVLNCPICHDTVAGGTASLHFHDHRCAADRRVLLQVMLRLDVMPEAVKEALLEAEREYERVQQAEADFQKVYEAYQRERYGSAY